MNWLQKAVSVVQNWLVVGGSPKIRDPQNGAGKADTTAGVPVGDQQALTISAFFSCLRLVAGTIATLPVPVFRRGRDGLAKEARDSQLWKVLHDSPNADQTALDYWEFVVISLLLRGHHFARKQMDGKRLIGLEPIRPDIVTYRRVENGSTRYSWTTDGKSFDLDESEVFHVRGFGGGLSVMGYAKQSLGIAIAAERTAGSLFGNGALPSGTLTFKDWLTPEQRKIAENDLTDQFVGAANSGRPMVLEGGVTWQSISINADDAQLLQSRAWSVEEVCRWFGVPPVLIGHNEKTTSWGSGVEQILLGFVKFTLMPYLRRIELAIAKQLISPQERVSGLYAEFNLEGLLRGDSMARARFYEVMTRIGVMSRNECRSKENLPPVPGGDEIMVQSQYISLEDALRQAADGMAAVQ